MYNPAIIVKTPNIFINKSVSTLIVNFAEK